MELSVRKTFWCRLLLPALLVIAESASGFGLGEMTTFSAINEPLRAEVELLAVRAGDMGKSEFRVANATQFARAGIDRSPALDRLLFRPEKRKKSYVLIITSEEPLTQPLLPVLIQATWSNRKLLREYTITPQGALAAQNTAPAVTAPVAAIPAPAVPTPAVPVPVPAPAPVPAVIPFPEPSDGEISFEEESTGEISFEEAPTTAAADSGISFDDQPQPAAPTTPTTTEQAAPPVEIAFDEEPIEEITAPVEPPTDTSVAAATQPAPGSGNNNIGEPLYTPEPATPAQPEAVAETAPAAPATDVKTGQRSDYTVSRNDTLYKVVKETISADSVAQAMLAFQSVNPDAFVDGNINKLKAGAVLRVPDQSDLAEWSVARAAAEVRRQNAQWASERTVLVRQEAVMETVENTGPAATASERLEIAGLPQTDASTGATAGGGADEEALKAELSLLQEQNRSRANELQEIESKIADLESMITKMDRIIELQNAEMAALQARLNGEEPPVPDLQAAEEQPAGSATMAQPVQTPEPATPEPVVEETSWIAENWMPLAGALAAAFLLLIGIVVVWRKVRSALDDADDETDPYRILEPNIA